MTDNDIIHMVSAPGWPSSQAGGQPGFTWRSIGVVGFYLPFSNVGHQLWWRPSRYDDWRVFEEPHSMTATSTDTYPHHTKNAAIAAVTDLIGAVSPLCGGC